MTMPRFSVLMPTYNRADTILRAIESVLAQTYADWELVVVDDGSTDGTFEKIANVDPRIRIIRQPNQGLAGARNTGMRSAAGDLVAFLDSDDEWLPHHLELASAFFDAFPLESVFTGEFWEDFGNGSYVKHFLVEAGQWAPRIAQRIRARGFDGPPPQGDPYLRFYQERTEAGDWARTVLERTPYAGAFHYRGSIFAAWQWEFFMAMQSTVVRREALAVVGLQDPRFPVSSDYEWGARLSRAFPVNMVNVPSCIKHEYGSAGRNLTEGHLVSGKTATQFHLEMLQIFEELYWKSRPEDPELKGIRAYRQLKVGEAALSQGRLEVARTHLREAVKGYPGPDTRALDWVARLSPSESIARSVYRGSVRFGSLARRALRLLRAR
jgi:glycosyltransferase involved in cell wall biosynthesis